ncbi:hypothetical protein PFICI_08459 [Pestalotiopsis fici W106-1]|uniref:MOSC domain-containing protein n=1 Tax=Pestalotiopsis fici (strain W106-1 / CGMCC3.15140) TaxID=1229662 RepID=W3X4D9_PESFW|nr:uncharacterized protein PFICI_08459 [Pestalotiopsis fici W106-1]ETS80930.1 hypothetical protein PFICI_08459 [Pestalotiopsis fici W106-1]
MEVLAVSRSIPKEYELRGMKISTSIIHDPLTSKNDSIELYDNGVVGNETAAHDGPVYAFFAENYDYWCSKLGVDRPSWDWCHWGENITFRHKERVFLEDDIHLGDVWKIGTSVRLEVCGSRIPCSKLAWRCGQKDQWLKPLADTGRTIYDHEANIARDQLNRGKAAWKGWRDLEVFRVAEEGNKVKSFYLRPLDGVPLANYLPGQFLSIQLPDRRIRNWTISDFPVRDSPTYYRISISKVNEASLWMHEQCKVGSILSSRSPAGQFFLDWTQELPFRQVYVSAGIGITPMLAMMKAHSIHPKYRKTPAAWVHVTKDSSALNFSGELSKLDHRFTRHLFFTDPLESDRRGLDYDYTGRPDAATMTRILGAPYHWAPLSDKILILDAKMSTYHICGPAAFESLIKECLKSAQIPAPMIKSESFSRAGAATGELKTAKVRFSKSGLCANWSQDKPQSILELAESVGLKPDYGCRVGACGSCAGRVTCGSVNGGIQPDGTILTCSAMPASEMVELEW